MAFQFMNSIYEKAKKNVKTIAIPEVTNEYMIKAAAKGDVTDIYDLTELAELSVAKTIQMPKEGSKQLDGAHSCEGTTSAMNKKVLLLMALQKGLNIKFSAQNTANLTDTRLIAQEVWKLLNL